MSGKQSSSHKSSFDAILNGAVEAVRAGDLMKGEALYRRLIIMRPREAALYAKLGDLLQRQGKLPDAIVMFRKAIKTTPNYGEAYMRLGNALLISGDALTAVEVYRRALKLNPRSPETLCNFGNALVNLNRHDEAFESFRKAIALRPDFADAYFNLGNGLLRAGRLEESLTALLKAIEMKPDMARGYSDLGNVLYLLGRRDQAITAYRRAISIDPGMAEAYSNLANPLTDSDQLDEALAMTLRSIQLNPHRPEAHSNLGNVLVAADKLRESLGPYKHALMLKPDHAEAHSNLGHVLARLGRQEESIAAYREAIRVAPDYADAHLFLAMTLLRQGAMREGWLEYEWRWKTRPFEAMARAHDAPLWNGEPLAGKEILLYAEQGLGDTLQFARYAAPLAALGGRVTLAVQPPLLRLVRTAPGVAAVIVDKDPWPRADYRLPLMSLPGILGPELTDIPAPPSYLSADPDMAERWKERLSAFSGLKVGLVWAGAARVHDRAANLTDRRRSLSLAQIQPILGSKGVTFFSLQKGPAAAQLRESQAPIVDYMDEIDDFADTAALVAALDLVISADTSVAHLAGAMGKPVWILSRFDGCWRWLEEGESSPWYPTARLFRQEKPGEWTTVIERVLQRLASFQSM